MSKVYDQSPSRCPHTQGWIDANASAQNKRQDQIVKEMDALGNQRDRWIEAFLERIQTRGFNVDGDDKRQIKPDEIPQKPDRPLKVIF